MLSMRNENIKANLKSYKISGLLSRNDIETQKW